MKRLLVLLLLLGWMYSGRSVIPVKLKQLNYARVQEAYSDKEQLVIRNLKNHSISTDSLRIFLQAFKAERLVRVWARQVSDSVFVPVRDFPICDLSGSVGPKRRYRDLQVPEGFYRIIGLNPFSKYFLSVQINYPNASDSILGVKGHLGNEIFIHGECVSSGCLAIGNEQIKELYIYLLEALNCGQEEIELSIFPALLNDENFNRLKGKYCRDQDKLALWSDLKKGYDLFEKYKVPPVVKFCSDGSHLVTEPPAIRNKLLLDSIRTRCSLNPLPVENQNIRVVLSDKH